MDFHKKNTIPPDGLKEFSVPEQLPAFIGVYPIQSLLEKGSMSILYLGLHPETHEPISIKVLPTPLVSRPEHVQRFLNEAEIVSMADHPNIVKLHGYGKWEGGLYIAMEFIAGITLKQYLLQHPVSLKRSLEIILDIAYALCHLHTHGVIHRDLKPDNILITGTGQIKVIDFGIAQLMTDEPSEIPATPKRLIGTPIYMSPEQRNEPDNVSYPSDIYSLGIIAYELVLGKLSYGHIHLGLMPKGLQKIINKALQTKLEDRYLDIVDFISDISAYLHSTTLEKEKKATDQVSELYESFQSAQRNLMNVYLPKSKDFETIALPHFGLGITPFYNDFLELADGTHVFVMGEATARGAKGVMHSAVVRGILHTLALEEKDPKNFLTKANAMLTHDPLNPSVALAALFLYPTEERFIFYSCGYGQLWLIHENTITQMKPNPGIALGIEKNALFDAYEGNWPPKSMLFLSPLGQIKHSLTSDPIMNEDLMAQVLGEFINLSLPKQLEGILRRAKALDPTGVEEHSFMLISFVKT